MDCKDTQACIHELNAYCATEPSGRALLVNTENYDVYQGIKETLEADSSKKAIYVSNDCPVDGLPDIDKILYRSTGEGRFAVFGVSQAALLRGAEYTERLIGKLLELPVHGHTIFLLDHCDHFLRAYFSSHPDISKRVILVEGTRSVMPRIHLASNKAECIGYNPYPDMQRFFAYLERLNDNVINNEPDVAVLTHFRPQLFNNALYSVTACNGVYENLVDQYPDIAAGTEKTFGTEKQWELLAQKLLQYKIVSAVVSSVFGSCDNLPSHIAQVFEEGNKDKEWFLWLSLKLFGTSGNKYLSRVLTQTNNVSDFVSTVYILLLDIPKDDKDFSQLYFERKHLLESIPENLPALDNYCQKIGIRMKDGIYYLTDATEKEELTFIQYLEKYDYSEEELLRITSFAWPAINMYLQNFQFTSANLKLSDEDEVFRGRLTDYFHRYKLQKLTNRIYPDFLKEVEQIAVERPYNRIPARTSLISKMDRNNTKLYFFDALGVEYLGYIEQRCRQYGLMAEIHIAHCELPSITSKNKEFLHFFKSDVFNIKELDELKHHSQMIDYQQCKEPVHIFRELQIIDKELRKIQAQLVWNGQSGSPKAVIVSDHGASRLAVIHETENDTLRLDEKGQHSGRCCPVDHDPKIPFASYWDGFAILANYDRFKGGRKANVEVHGGGSLEEVLVPIIVLRNRPKDIEVKFVNSTVILKGGQPAEIIVFSNILLNNPRLLVNGIFYQGQFCEDHMHVKFSMPEIKRTKDWVAEFYDGDELLASSLQFHTKKGTQEQSLFKKMPF